MIERLILPRELRDRIAAEAGAAFPRECCGLIEGRRDGDMAEAFASHAVRNLASGPDRFELDPAEQLRLTRCLRGTDRELIGCYHSHPNGRAELSPRDRAGAGEDDFVWLIAGVTRSRPDDLVLPRGAQRHLARSRNRRKRRACEMHLIFIHGPAASGKLTVARELAKLTGLPLFHNHLVVDAVAALFPFGSAPFVRLREETWLAAFREAAEADHSLIFTFAPERTVRPEFIARSDRDGGKPRRAREFRGTDLRAGRTRTPGRSAVAGRVRKARFQGILPRNC